MSMTIHECSRRTMPPMTCARPIAGRSGRGVPGAHRPLRRARPRLGAVDRDGALAEARRCDEEIKRGQYRGPLHGIPLGIKDIFDVFDWPTAAGSKLWAEQHRPAGRHGGAASAPGRGDLPRQDGDDAVRQLRSAGDAQPVEPRAHARRLQQRLGGGGGVRHVPGSARLADRRLDHAAGVLLRRGGLQADLRPGQHRRRRAAGAVDGSSRPDGPLRARPGRSCCKRSPARIRSIPSAVGPQCRTSPARTPARHRASAACAVSSSFGPTRSRRAMMDAFATG